MNINRTDLKDLLNQLIKACPDFKMCQFIPIMGFFHDIKFDPQNKVFTLKK
jgi:hypothetical protein